MQLGILFQDHSIKGQRDSSFFTQPQDCYQPEFQTISIFPTSSCSEAPRVTQFSISTSSVIYPRLCEFSTLLNLVLPLSHMIMLKVKVPNSNLVLPLSQMIMLKFMVPNSLCQGQSPILEMIIHTIHQTCIYLQRSPISYQSTGLLSYVTL